MQDGRRFVTLLKQVAWVRYQSKTRIETGCKTRGLMDGQGNGATKIFQELGLFAMSLETQPRFEDICDGTFSNPVHEGVHEEEDVSYCNMVKSCNLPNTCSSLIRCRQNRATQLRY
ncbi:uncharacterized protein TNCV_2056721 [Trichonephila clavipes]|nr:uncharacterized protein TNCV_2056721 [Trichonephila clavipes]